MTEPEGLSRTFARQVRSGGSSRGSKTPFAIPPSKPHPSGKYPTRVYAQVGDKRWTRGAGPDTPPRQQTADLQTGGYTRLTICVGVAQQNMHEDGRFPEGTMGDIAQLHGRSCYVYQGELVTLLIYRVAGDAMFFDNAWAEGRRALTFEGGRLVLLTPLSPPHTT